MQSFQHCLESLRIIAFALLFQCRISRKRRTDEHRLLMASFRIRRDFVRAYSKISPSASNVFCAGGGIAVLPRSERRARIRWRTFNARIRLCFEASSSSSRSWIALGVIDIRPERSYEHYSRQDRLRRPSDRYFCCKICRFNQEVRERERETNHIAAILV
jgi:hypothetical protein